MRTKWKTCLVAERDCYRVLSLESTVALGSELKSSNVFSVDE